MISKYCSRVCNWCCFLEDFRIENNIWVFIFFYRMINIGVYCFCVGCYVVVMVLNNYVNFCKIGLVNNILVLFFGWVKVFEIYWCLVIFLK